jgi:hypothetical protein
MKIKNIRRTINNSDWFKHNNLCIKAYYGNQSCKSPINWKNDTSICDEYFMFEHDPKCDHIKLMICNDHTWSCISVLHNVNIPIINYNGIMAHNKGVIDYEIGKSNLY